MISLTIWSSGHISLSRKMDGIADLPDSVYTSYFKEICKIAKYGRNVRGLAVYVRDDISKRVRHFGEHERHFLDRIREENSSYLEM
jgi:glucan biosynthesis protein